MDKKFKVIFLGTPQIAVEVLNALHHMDNVEIKMVISQPDKKIGRKKLLTPTPVKKYAIDNDLPIIQPEKIGTEFELIKTIRPDFIITCAYGQFIPNKILSIPTIDSINFHGSLLPKYRGGAPIQYAIANGDKTTGMTIMKMVSKMDAGPYYVKNSIKITDQDDYGTIFDKLGKLSAQMVQQNLTKIANNELKLIDQNENMVTFSPNILPNQEQINWNKNARDVFNQIRSLSPTPIAFTLLNEKRYKIKSARLLTNQDIFPITAKVHFPGEIVYMDNEGIVVATKIGYLKILEIQRPGKTMSNAGLYHQHNLQDLKIGTIFK